MCTGGLLDDPGLRQCRRSLPRLLLEPWRYQQLVLGQRPGVLQGWLGEPVLHLQFLWCVHRPIRPDLLSGRIADDHHARGLKSAQCELQSGAYQLQLDQLRLQHVPGQRYGQADRHDHLLGARDQFWRHGKHGQRDGHGYVAGLYQRHGVERVSLRVPCRHVDGRR